jgi:hypothetical protein
MEVREEHRTQMIERFSGLQHIPYTAPAPVDPLRDQDIPMISPIGSDSWMPRL